MILKSALNRFKAIQAAKQLIMDITDKAIDDRPIADTLARIARIRVSDEGQDGLKAFLQKRRPQWHNP